MNCETFQMILQDLGKDSALNLRTRQDGLAHAEACPNCAILLKNECRLVAGLGAVATSFENAGAPTAVEEALLKAFRSQRIQRETEELTDGTKVMQALPSPRSASNRPITSAPSPQPVAKRKKFSLGGRSHTWSAWPIRMAAVSLLAVGLAVWVSWQTSGRKPSAVADRVGPSPSKVISQVPLSKQLPHETETVPKVTQARSPEARTGHRATREPAISAIRSQNAAGQSDRKEPEVEASAALDQTEVATEFLPLGYEDSISSSVEGGQIVRVRLPRATLLSFGFPMSEERAPEPIKADVLVGEDGMARAIRFVH